MSAAPLTMNNNFDFTSPFNSNVNNNDSNDELSPPLLLTQRTESSTMSETQPYKTIVEDKDLEGVEPNSDEEESSIDSLEQSYNKYQSVQDEDDEKQNIVDTIVNKNAEETGLLEKFDTPEKDKP
eukprot:UN30691